jgi:hypothetical protein
MIKNTLVRTPSGAKPINELRAGDVVCNEFGKPVQVKQVILKGRHPIVDLFVSGNEPWVTCDREQKLLIKECCGPKQFIMEIRSVSNFSKSNRIVTVIEGQPFGCGLTVTINDAQMEDETFDLDVESNTNLYLLESGLIAHS